MSTVDPRTVRRRLAVVGVILLPLLLLVFGWHARDALRHGESLWPVVLGAGLSLAVLGGTVAYVTREGRANVARRAARLMKWVAPIAAAIAALRAVAWLAGWQ